MNITQHNPELLKALAQFQYECPIIHKSAKGYGYSYADLPTIIEKITPLLKKYELGFTQIIQGTSIMTVVFHFPTGQTIESTADLFVGLDFKGMNQLQVYGSQLSYMRRYALTSILGIVSDSDIDGQGQPKKKAEKATDKALNDQQFIRAIQAVNNGTLSIDNLKSNYKLTESQILTLDELNAE
jgi:hypothetical protein